MEWQFMLYIWACDSVQFESGYCASKCIYVGLYLSFQIGVFWLISPLCRIYVSVNRGNIGSDYGVSSFRRQAII